MRGSRRGGSGHREPPVESLLVSINCSLSQGNHRQGLDFAACLPPNLTGQNWKKNKGNKCVCGRQTEVTFCLNFSQWFSSLVSLSLPTHLGGNRRGYPHAVQRCSATSPTPLRPQSGFLVRSQPCGFQLSHVAQVMLKLSRTLSGCGAQCEFCCCLE